MTTLKTNLEPACIGNPPVPLLDLKRQYAAIQQEIEAALIECARSVQYILGPVVEAFEREAAAYCGAAHAVAVTSGSDALIMALMAEDIGPGDEVIAPPFTFFATAGAVSRVGATPVFVDIEPDGFNIDPRAFEKAITPKTRAVIPVHLFGQCAEMDAIMDIAARHRLVVIEDAAQSIGSEYKGRRAGSMGHYGCFSFFPSKNLGCMGDAGLMTTNDAERARRLVLLRNHGRGAMYVDDRVGGNFRCDALQAAVLRVKLPHLDSWTAGRQRNSGVYRELFSAMPANSMTCPPELPDRRHIYNQFTIRVKNGKRDAVMNFLRERKIGCQVYYPLPLHLQPCFQYLGGKAGDLPVSEAAANEVLSLPIFPELTREEIECVAGAVKGKCR